MKTILQFYILWEDTGDATTGCMMLLVRYVRFVKIVSTSLQFYTYQENTKVKSTGLVYWRWLDLLKLCKQINDSIHNKKTFREDYRIFRSCNVYRFAKFVETSLQFFIQWGRTGKMNIGFSEIVDFKDSNQICRFIWTILQL